MVEYKLAHILDKSLESSFGYITVLPGAFSAYKWEALQGEPLDEYFEMFRKPDEMSCFKANVYLAEDRILCLALVAKKRKAYTLRYVQKSVAETDVPDGFGVLLKQRRRWINGSWFALIHTISNFYKLERT
jgi:chitin synthase